MASRREDEKNERIIRGLLKLPENRKCINCNSLGPQYVCTNFWTFVCTTCSGIHREFTHRVKSISMAKFTSQEVSALQQGGNQRAKEIFFKDWDPQRHSFPDGSNVERLRDFIKHVYVDRRFSGERNFDKPPRVKGDKDETYQGGSRSPPYEDVYDRRFSGKSSPGGRSDDRNYRYGFDERRSPGYDQDKRSPARPEIINDWRREDRFGNGRRSEDRSDGDVRSPDRQSYSDTSSPPIVRPVRDILGENVVPLRISEPPKPTAKGGDTSVHTQRTASSSSLASTNDNPVEVKLENPKSLIDFDADPGPPAVAVPQAPQQTTAAQPAVQSSGSSNDNNWASFDVAPEVKVTQAPSNLNPLESVLSGLSVPGSGGPTVSPGDSLTMLVNSTTAGHVGNATAQAPSASTASGASVGDLSTLLSGGAPAVAHGSNQAPPAAQWSSAQQQQQQPSLYAVSSSHPTTQQFSTGDMFASNQGPHASTRPVQEVTSGAGSQPSVQVNSSSRKALPEDLFTAMYPSYPAPVPGWQTGPPHGTMFPMQYNAAVPMQNFQQSSKSLNPFDFSREAAPVQAPTFPSMASLHGALPNIPPQSGLLPTSSLGTPSPAFIPQQTPPYPSAVPPQPSIFPAGIPRPYNMVPPQAGTVQPSSHQGFGGIGGDGAVLNSSSMDQQFSRDFSAAATPNPFSSVGGGNPFG